MNAAQRPAHAELTDYERDQVRQIAAWKSEPPNPLAGMFKRITLPGAKVVEQVIHRARGMAPEGPAAAEGAPALAPA
jgi:hypothetical protein